VQSPRLLSPHTFLERALPYTEDDGEQLRLGELVGPSASSRSRGRSSFGQFLMRSDFMLLPSWSRCAAVVFPWSDHVTLFRYHNQGLPPSK
jgi:hypothetical protein